MQPAHCWLNLVFALIPLCATAAGHVPASPEDGGPRSFTLTGVSTGLTLRRAPSTAAESVALLKPDAILDNLGCREAEGRAWCYVQPLGGGPVGYVAASYLQGAVSPDGSIATGPETSALRIGRGDYDARGSVPCARVSGQPMGRCNFRVARDGGGYATVVVERPDGGERVIFFRLGIPIGVGSAEADPAGAFSTSKVSDLHMIHVGEERYEIPDAVVLGG